MHKICSVNNLIVLILLLIPEQGFKEFLFWSNLHETEEAVQWTSSASVEF